MANVLKRERKVLIVKLLTEGMTARAVARTTGHHLATVLRVLNEAGEHCQKLLDERMRGLALDQLQLDETWTYCICKRARVRLDHPAKAGDQFVYIALDPISKAVVSFSLGRRDNQTTYQFVADLAERFEGRVHLSTDGWRAYETGVARYLPGRTDYGMLIKNYGQPDDPDANHRYTPPKVVSVQWYSVAGFPRRDKLCTSHIERFNASLRTYCRRFARLTLAFSRKLENLRNAVALAIADYDFCKSDRAVGMPPGMALGVIEGPWTADRLVP